MMNRQKREMILGWLALLACLIVVSAISCTEAVGQCVTPHPAVVRICNVFGQERSYGSGTVVGAEYVLTCAHLFGDGVGRIGVAFPGGTGSAATILAIDQTWDLALLKLETASTATPVAIATEFARPGDPLQFSGYGSDGCYRPVSGQALGYVKAGRQTTYETLAMAGAAREGDSGGPILNASGELVAVLWGTGDRTVNGTCCLRIRKFLGGLLGLGRSPPVQPRPAWNPWPGLVPVRPPIQPTAPAPQAGQLGPRFDAIESLLGRLGDRLGNGPAPPTADVIQATVAPILDSHLSGLVSMATPWLLGLLGVSAAGPAGLGVWGAVALFRAWRKKRRRSGGALPQLPTPLPCPPCQPPTPTGAPDVPGDVFQRDLEEARQLLQLSQMEGRSPLSDAIVGRFAQDELANIAEASAGQPEGDWARQLLRKLIDRFNAVAPLATGP